MKAAGLISGSVGQRGANQGLDVRIVQRLLNDWLSRTQQTQLKMDGIVGPKTLGAISSFQKNHALGTDGRVDPMGPTIQVMFQEHIAGLQVMIDVSRVSNYVDGLAVKQTALSDSGLALLIEQYVKALRKDA